MSDLFQSKNTMYGPLLQTGAGGGAAGEAAAAAAAAAAAGFDRSRVARLAEVEAQRAQQRVRGQLCLVHGAVRSGEVIRAIGAEVAIAQAEIDRARDRHGHAADQLPCKAAVVIVDVSRFRCVFAQRGASPAHAAAGIGLDATPVADAEQRIGHGCGRGGLA
jgi:hypothetical protein